MQRDTSTEDSKDTSQRIFSSATRLFASKGYDGTSTKEICEDAKVNIAAIHYHFDTKEDLFRRIVESYGTLRLEAVQRTLQNPETKEEVRIRLKLFIQESIESYLRNADLVRIIHRESELLHRNSSDIFQKTFLKIYETLVAFLTLAKKRKLISRKMDPDLAAEFLSSQIRNKIQNERIYSLYLNHSVSDPVYRAHWIQETLRLFLEGIQ